MAELFLTVGGLADSYASLEPWHSALPDGRCRYVETNEREDFGRGWSFADRVRVLRSAINHAQNPVYLVGQSAGGLAALVLASSPFEKARQKIKGVIAVSPAMPRGINPVGLQLARVMWRYRRQMMKGAMIKTDPADYEYIALNGVEHHRVRTLVRNRKRISGVEANDLACFWRRPRIDALDVPVCIVCGKDDRWVRSKAHIALARRLQAGLNAGPTTFVPVPDAGHLPLHSRRAWGDDVAKRALESVIE